jgi:hypothetical protein
VKLVRLSWYLCGVSSVALIFSAAITVAPEAQKHFMVLRGVLAVFAGAFAGVAILLGSRLRTHWIHESRAVAIAFWGLAAMLTVLMFATVG